MDDVTAPGPMEPIEGRCNARRLDEDGNLCGYCKRWPSKGTNRCRKHGAGAPQTKAKAERVIAQEKAERAVARLGLRREGITPEAALQEALERTAGNVDALEQLLLSTAPGEDTQSEVHRLYDETIDRLAKVGKMMADAGVAERQVAIQEAHVLLFAQAIQQILAGLHLTPAQQQLAPQVVEQAMLSLETS